MGSIIGKADRLRLAYALAAFAIGLGFGLWPRPSDFPLFWYVGLHPGAPYDFNLVHRRDFALVDNTYKPTEFLPFGYPPTILPLLRLLAFIPLPAARALWCAGWCAAFIYTVSRDTRRVTPLLFLSAPLLLSLTFGQTGLMIGTLVVAGFQRLDERPRLAGVLLGLAACIKPQAMLLAPIILWGRWDVVRAAMLSSVCAVLTSLAFGPHLWLEWASSLPKFSAYVAPNSFHVSPAYAFDGLPWRVGIFAVGLWFAWRERNLTGLLTGNLLCTPYVQFYDLVGFSYIGARYVAKGRQASAVEMVLGLALIVCMAWPRLMVIYCAVLIGLSLAKSWRANRSEQIPAYQT